jgi:hypothetical protein
MNSILIRVAVLLIRMIQFNLAANLLSEAIASFRRTNQKP